MAAYAAVSSSCPSHLRLTLTLRFPPFPAVRICESCAGAPGDPQLWPGGVGRHQVSDRLLSLGGRWLCVCTKGGGGWVPRQPPGVVASSSLPPGLPPRVSGAHLGHASSRGSRLQLRSHAPEPGPGEEGRSGWGGAGRARTRGRNPWGHHGLPTRPERGNALPAPGGSQAFQAGWLPRGEGPGGPQRSPRRSSSQKP